MDSLHVSGQQSNSKASSRSASPCRPRHASEHVPAHHESVSVRQRQRSPTTRHRSPTSLAAAAPMDDPSTPLRLPQERLEELVTECAATDDDPCYSSFLSNGSSEHVTYDETDGNATSKALAAMEHLNKKIVRVRDSIRLEQTLRDDNVNEYLKLAVNADKQQLQRIKAVFEKKNQKSAHMISQLQKKLDGYTKRLKELETHGLAQGAHRPPREVLRDMGQGLKNVGGNIRDGITGLGGSVMSKPREFAHLIKNKFGSADNISHLSTWYVGGGGGSDSGAAEGTCAAPGSGSDTGGAGSASGADKIHHGSATLPSGAVSGVLRSGGALRSREDSECSSVTSESLPGAAGTHAARGTSAAGSDPAGSFSLKRIFTELREQQRDDLQRISERMDDYRALHQEVQYLSGALQEERFRLERLEEQVNDLTELHQNEVENLKQALADMEEKVQYQSEERLRDIHEMLEHCQTKMQKMEHQALQQQQYVSLEGLDNSNARALVVKLINVVLTVLQVVLLLVATVAGITMPFLRTRVRFLSTLSIVLLLVFVLRQWPELRDIGSHVVHHLKQTLDPLK